jgi:hypothetical protein
MKHRIPLLLAAISLALAGCANDAPTDRPRLLTDEEARIGDVNWLHAGSVSLNQPVEMMNVELTSCSRMQEVSTKPRLVIGEPACVFGSYREAGRID